MDLYDLMRQAQGGNGFATLGQQFGLGQDQMQQAVEALMPAFASGLQRNTTDPMGMLKFMQALSSGQHAGYYDNPANAFSPAGRAEGDAILGHLFGSKDVSRALADQAFQATGIGQSILKQLLPVIASMVLGGLFKQGRSGSNPIIDKILREFGGAVGGGSGRGDNNTRGPLDRYEEEQTRQPESRREQAPPSGQGSNPFGRMLEEMFGGGQKGSAGGSANSGGAAGPLGEIFDQFTRNMPGNQSANQSGSQASDRSGFSQPGADEPAQAPSGLDIFGEMFEPGRKMGDAYQKNVESIFDQFLGGLNRK